MFFEGFILPNQVDIIHCTFPTDCLYLLQLGLALRNIRHMESPCMVKIAHSYRRPSTADMYGTRAIERVLGTTESDDDDVTPRCDIKPSGMLLVSWCSTYVVLLLCCAFGYMLNHLLCFRL